MGDTWDKSQKGLKKLTRTGWVLVGLLVLIALPVSIYTMTKSKEMDSRSRETHIDGEVAHVDGEVAHDKLIKDLKKSLNAADSLHDKIKNTNKMLEGFELSFIEKLRATGARIKGAVQSTAQPIKTEITTSEGNLRSTIAID